MDRNESNSTQNDSTAVSSPAAPGSSSNAKAKRNAPRASRVAQAPMQYQVHGTVVEMSMRIGDKNLARSVKKLWEGIHHSIHYLTDFSRRSLKGKVVTAANRGVGEYLREKSIEAAEMLKVATDKADVNGIKMGRAGSVQEIDVMVSSEVERDVIDLIKVLDDYVIVMDSLWIGRVIDTKKRDDAHDEVTRIIGKLHTLLTKMRTKMIEFRRKKMTNRLTKDEELYALELETLVLDVTGIDLRKIRAAEEAAAQASKKAKTAKAAPADRAEVAETVHQAANSEVELAIAA